MPGGGRQRPPRRGHASDARNGHVAVNTRHVVVITAGLDAVERGDGEGRNAERKPFAGTGEIELGGVETPGSGVVDRTVVIQRLVEQVGGIGHRSPGCRPDASR